MGNRPEGNNFRHGMSKTRTWNSWSDMKSRCRNPKTTMWRFYGGRGISYCPEWERFDAFLKDMGECPDGFSLERIDVNKGYYRKNCKWMEKKLQARNTRRSRFIEYEGQRKTLAEWAEITGINHGTLQTRLNSGYSLDDAFYKGRFSNGSTKGRPRIRE